MFEKVNPDHCDKQADRIAGAIVDLAYGLQENPRIPLITENPKLEEFKQELLNNKILKSGKKIIFTESKETAQYVGKALKEIFTDKVVIFSGESSPALKKQIEKSFNPKCTDGNEDKYDILITTDVLAEGINLHKANILINYDLPWNPTRIMQRVGRINRVGSSFDKIYVFNFLPTSATNAQLPLEERIMEKLQAFHDTLGEDYKYLSDEEVVSSHKLYEILTKKQDEDNDGINPELQYLALIRKIRDEDIALFEKIKKLPVKSKSSKKNSNIDTESVITFFRKGPLKAFYLSNANESKELTFLDAVDYIKATPSVKRIKIEDTYYNLLNKNKHQFDTKIDFEDLITEESIKVSNAGNDGQIKKILKSILSCRQFTTTEVDNINKMLDLFENGEIPANLSKQIMQVLKKIDGGKECAVEIYHVIYDKIPTLYFEEKQDTSKNKTLKKQIILSCYLREE